MKFLSRQLSERLSKLNLKSESGFYWCGHPEEEPYICGKAYHQEGTLSAFTLLDLCDVSLQARENAKLIWPGDLCSCGRTDCDQLIDGHDFQVNWEYHRHALIDLPDHEAVEGWIAKAIEERKG